MSIGFNPFRSFRQAIFPSYLAVDIGTTSVKAIEVRPGKQLPQLLNYGILESTDYLGRSNSALQTSNLKLFDQDVIQFLMEIKAKMKPQATEVIASLPVFSAFFTVIAMPEMPKEEIKQALAFQAKQYIPIPLSEVQFEWQKVGEYEDDKGFRYQHVLLIAVPIEHITRYQRIFSTAGFHLKTLEVESVALARMLIGNDPTPTAIVDIGSRSTSISFVEKGQLRSVTQSDFAGASLTQAVATGLNINPLRAEDLKKQKGISGMGVDYELSTLMVPFVDVILNEIRKAFYNYTNQFTYAAKIERIVLSGGTANLRGIEKYMERELQLPIVKAAPFARFEYPAAMEPLIGELNPTLSVALGLAYGELSS